MIFKSLLAPVYIFFGRILWFIIFVCLQWHKMLTCFFRCMPSEHEHDECKNRKEDKNDSIWYVTQCD